MQTNLKIPQITKQTVRIIPASIIKNIHKNLAPKRRTAGYARVSTDSDEQLTSYEAQVDYYTKYIQERQDWQFVKVYTDEGISATNTKKRDGFKKMIEDALEGKIDLIVTKSVSRFARNTVDSLTTVRKLKEKGIEIYFEKENIWTLDSKGELLITIMSSLAQEESRSISENVTWGKRKQMADDKVSLPYKQFLGYEKGENGLPKIIESEAKTVRTIFKLFINGKTPSAIAKHLTNQNILSPGGKKIWQVATVRSILRNEKYKGDALLQKTFTVDFLSKRLKLNEGEIPQYYVKDSHQAIIDPDEFDAVQAEIERRKNFGRFAGCKSPFSSKIVCGECGSFFGSKVWNSTNKYRRVIWRCNAKYQRKGMNERIDGKIGGNINEIGEKIKCRTPHITEEEIKDEFLKVFNKLIGNRKELIEDCKLAQKTICDCTEIESELSRLYQEIEVISELAKKSIYESARTAVNQEEFDKRNNGYLEKHKKLTENINNLEKEKREKQNKFLEIKNFIKNIKTQSLVLNEFDEDLWFAVVESVTVGVGGEMVFRFRGGRRE
ncbi:MAG: recombinase family protein [Oscillospiraceae bacterium]|jgi:DNA invertase Pin-like site-specific DNA recombinase|nr:recombinase family protein [Oscillospiraceae bacterium]